MNNEKDCFEDKFAIDEIKKTLPFDEQQRRKHEEAHSSLIDGYTDYQLTALKRKTKYKNWFFWVCMAILVVPLLFFLCMIAFYSSAQSSDIYTIVVLSFGQLVSFVSAVIILPKTIAEYCFNKNEDDSVLKLFLNLKKTDKI